MNAPSASQPKRPSGAAFLIDQSLRYVVAEGDALRAAGMQPSSLVNKSVLDVLPDQHVANVRCVLGGGEFEVRHGVGTRSFLSRGTPVFDQDGAVWAALVISYDVTDDSGQDSSRGEPSLRRPDFLGVLAHELRNPLAPLRTSVEVLRQSGHAPDVVAQVCNIMDRQVAHMSRLVEDLFDISRLALGKGQLACAPADLTDMIATAVEAHQAAIASRKIALDVDLGEPGLTVNVDRTRFIQIVSNILDNAIKFTRPGGRVGIRSSVEHTGEESLLALKIRDSGVGFHAETAAKMFELFSQGPLEVTDSRGLGIGLAVAKTLVELHGGSITALSDGPGTGSEFTIRVPMGRP